MLQELFNCIDHALLSCVKRVEESQAHLDVNHDLDALLFSTRKLSEGLKGDIRAIAHICRRARQANSQPKECIEQLFSHIQTMKTWFFFFPAHAKLREAILYALEQYEPQCIKWVGGRPFMNDTHFISVPRGVPAPALVVERNPGRDSSLQAQINALREEMVLQRQETARLTNLLVDTQRQLKEERADNIALRGALLERSSLSPADASAAQSPDLRSSPDFSNVNPPGNRL
jgi:hypothetical protein